MAIPRREKPMPGIPTSSMGDIVFLLLIFFMATTIFKKENGLPVNLPRAEASRKQKSEQLAQIWVDQTDGSRSTITWSNSMTSRPS